MWLGLGFYALDLMGFVGGFAFGPVPSRRLGRSLGVNNIPCKFCILCLLPAW